MMPIAITFLRIDPRERTQEAAPAAPAARWWRRTTTRYRMYRVCGWGRLAAAWAVCQPGRRNGTTLPPADGA